MVSQSEYNTTKQSNRDLYYKINLLNYNFQVVDELSGVVLSDSWTIDATSNIRRTGSIVISPNDDTSFKIKSGSKIWLDKYVQVYIGIKDIYAQEIAYTNMGIYLVNNPNQVFSSTDNSITLSLIDLMSKLTGERNGSLDEYTHQIPQGSDIRQAIIAILEECDFYDYIIEIQDDDYKTTPYDISVETGNSYYELLSKLNEVNINYQMYFDVNGVFHYERIPSGHNEQIMIDNDIWDKCYISHNVNTNFEEMKNHIIVLGKTQENYNNCTVKSVINTTYFLESGSVTQLVNNVKIGFTSEYKPNNPPKIYLNDFGSYPIKDEYGNIPTNLDIDTYYIFKFQLDSENLENSYWLFMGEITPKGVAKDEDPRSPFYINGTIGDIKIVLSGGEYDNITTADLAKQRAEWELYTRCRLQDSVTVETVPIYWCDVNWLTNIKFPNETEEQLFMIKRINITGGVNGTQSIEMAKYYSFYE